MKNLDEEIKRIQEVKADIAALEAESRRLMQKSNDLSAKTAEITAAIEKTKSERESVLLRFTNDEITNDQLAIFKDDTPRLKNERENFLSAATVVSIKLDEISETKKRRGSALKSIKSGVLAIISDEETQKAINPIQKSYVAHCRAFGRIEFSEFINRIDFKLKFHLSPDEFNKIGEELEQIYV